MIFHLQGISSLSTMSWRVKLQLGGERIEGYLLLGWQRGAGQKQVKNRSKWSKQVKTGQNLRFLNETNHAYESLLVFISKTA